MSEKDTYFSRREPFLYGKETYLSKKGYLFFKEDKKGEWFAHVYGAFLRLETLEFFLAIFDFLNSSFCVRIKIILRTKALKIK